MGLTAPKGLTTMTDKARLDEAKRQAMMAVEDSAHLYGERRISAPLKRYARLHRADAVAELYRGGRRMPKAIREELEAAILAVLGEVK